MRSVLHRCTTFCPRLLPDTWREKGSLRSAGSLRGSPLLKEPVRTLIEGLVTRCWSSDYLNFAAPSAGAAEKLLGAPTQNPFKQAILLHNPGAALVKRTVALAGLGRSETSSVPTSID